MVEQVSYNSAVSTVKLIDIAAQAAGNKIYRGTSANFATAVWPNLISCNQTTLQGEINAGNTLIIPQKCNLVERSWTGAGYFSMSGNSILWRPSPGDWRVDFASAPQPPPAVNPVSASLQINPQAAVKAVGLSYSDPIDLVKGHFLYDHTDLTTGVGEFPVSLSFGRSLRFRICAPAAVRSGMVGRITW